MLSSRRIPYQVVNQSPELCFLDVDQGLCPQILGNDEKLITESIKKLESWGAVAIDINMGCPVQKALKHNYGVALMGDPQYAAQITKWAAKSSARPVSVKLRAGLQNDVKFLVDFCLGLQDAGASWITLHPRLASQGRKGLADLEQLRLLKAQLTVPLIGNADVREAADVDRLMQATGCDRVMVGRALIARPWMLSDFCQKNGAWTFVSRQRSQLELKELFAKYSVKVLQNMRLAYADPEGIRRRFSFFMNYASVFLDFGHALVSFTRKQQSLDELEQGLHIFFGQDLRFCQDAELR
jgi:tRNA-dihydrouridine synthase